MLKTVLSIALIVFIFQGCQKQVYIKNTGSIFGTSYHFTYDSPNGNNLENEILVELNKFNKSLSTYDKNSIISKINQDDTNIVVDKYFKYCFLKAKEIYKFTEGAFDMTVAPIVNAWGFGFDKAIVADSTIIDSLMQYVGFDKISLSGDKIKKEKPGIMLDASAIAKGYGVDIAAELLEDKGIQNYMVEIGGEVRAKGKNENRKYWRIGIDKPIDNVYGINRELQTVVGLKNKSLATSGNYRQYYEIDGIKYAHTINPKTGYPALSSLLSATVLADDCITADAFATAFMVLGKDKSIELANKLDFIEVFFIYSDVNNKFLTYQSEKLKLTKK